MAHLKHMVSETESDYGELLDVDQNWAREDLVLAVSDTLRGLLEFVLMSLCAALWDISVVLWGILSVALGRILNKWINRTQGLSLDGNSNEAPTGGQKGSQLQGTPVNHKAPFSGTPAGYPGTEPSPGTVRWTPSTIARDEAKLPATPQPQHKLPRRSYAFCYETPDAFRKSEHSKTVTGADGLLTPPTTPLEKKRSMRSRGMYLVDRSTEDRDGSLALTPFTSLTILQTSNATRNAMLTELLGFVPQLLLDDIADAATDTVNNAIDGLEAYLRNDWLANHQAQDGQKQTMTDELEAEIESGLLEFHTLLCGHRDMSIDMLETWSMRNVFYVPPDLSIVMPHQKGLDLSTPHGKDVQMQVELDVLRRKIENARKFQAQLKEADMIAQHSLARAKKRLEQLAFLRGLDPAQVDSLPDSIRTLLAAIRTLPASAPPLPPTTTTAASSSRQHTASRPEFLDWAVKRLVPAGSSGPSPIFGGSGGDLGALVQDVRADEEGEEERRFLSATNTTVAAPSSSQEKAHEGLSIIQEEDQDRSFAELHLEQPDPSLSQTQVSLSQASDVSLSVTQTSSVDASTSSVKRRRSSVVGGSKRRRSSLGLAERARVTSSTNGSGTNGATGINGTGGRDLNGAGEH